MIYISGPMTGIENYNYPEFIRVANSLKQLGEKIINPVEICSHLDGKSASWQDYMDICLPAVDKCDTIYLLKGWQRSKGAKLELFRAMEKGLDSILQSEVNI